MVSRREVLFQERGVVSRRCGFPGSGGGFLGGFLGFGVSSFRGSQFGCLLVDPELALHDFFLTDAQAHFVI